MKWNPANALAIKREVEDLQKQRVVLFNEINGIEGEKEGLVQILNKLETDIKRRRELLTTLDESVTSRYAKVTTDIQKVEKDLHELKNQKTTLQTTIEVMKNGLYELMNVDIPDTTSLQRSIIVEMQNKIDALIFAAKNKEYEVRKLDIDCNKKKQEVENLVEEKEKIEKEKQDVHAELIVAQEKFRDTLHSLQRSENQIKDLRNRERDLLIKERRLNPEYIRVFNKVNRTKK